MSRLLILTTPDLAPGYRLAGVPSLEVSSAAEAALRIEELLEHEHGVVAVHEPYFRALDRALRKRLDAVRAPLVVPLPAGTGTDGAGARRDHLLQMLWQAVGYEITFDNERSST